MRNLNIFGESNFYLLYSSNLLVITLQETSKVGEKKKQSLRGVDKLNKFISSKEVMA